MIDDRMGNRPEIRALTGLRFVAAFYVFVFHIHLRWPLAPAGSWLANLIGQGAIGMSLFFLLSGFVLAYRYASLEFSFKDYFANRLSRIYPVYLLAALLTLPWIGFDPGTDYGLSRIVALVLIDALVLQAWFPQLFPFWNNGGSWSISVEMFCYMVLPFVFRPFRTLARKQLLLAAAALYGLAVLPGLTLALFYGEFGRSFYTLPIYRLPEFLLGALIWFAVLQGVRIPRILLPVALAVLAAYLGLAGGRLPMWVGHNWIVLPVIALTIFSLATQPGLIGRLLSTAPMMWLGKVSYSFYSLQLLLLLYLKDHHAALVVRFPMLADNLLLLAVSLAVLVGLAGLSYHLVEEPARLWISRWYQRRKAARPAVPAPASA